MSGHSRYAPSGRERWANCPGSVKLIDALDLPDIDTVYSAEGTEAHRIAADSLLTGKVPKDPAIRAYVEFVSALPGVKLVEEKLRHPELQDLYGTPDLLIYDFGGRLIVVDFKFGEGVLVSPEGNLQLQMYAVLAFACGLNEVEEVCFCIVQPRTEEPTKWVCFPAALVAEWQAQILAEIEVAKQDAAPLVSGRHCQFCKAKPHCPVLRQNAHTVSVYEAGLPEPARLHPDQLRWLLDNRSRIRDYLNAVDEYALQQALIGALPGWKAVTGLKNREWIDEKAVLRGAKQMGYKLNELAPRALLSPAQMEKIVGKPWVAEKVKRDPGSPKLVRDDAPGEAVNVLAGFEVVKTE